MISHENISASNLQKNKKTPVWSWKIFLKKECIGADAVHENPKIETFEIADTYKA